MNSKTLCSIHADTHVIAVHRSELILITGPVGSGKTRLLRRLAGLTPLPTTFSLEWSGTITTRMLFDHTPPLWLAPTLGEELIFGLHPVPSDPELHKVRTLWGLETISLDTQVESLDRLQSLRLALASAELAHTGLALLDNPTASLPLEDAEVLRKDISAWIKRSECAVVIACNRWQDWPSWVQKIWRLAVDEDMPVMEIPHD